jgi:hypothetical protein
MADKLYTLDSLSRMSLDSLKEIQKKLGFPNTSITQASVIVARIVDRQNTIRAVDEFVKMRESGNTIDSISQTFSLEDLKLASLSTLSKWGQIMGIPNAEKQIRTALISDITRVFTKRGVARKPGTLPASFPRWAEITPAYINSASRPDIRTMAVALGIQGGTDPEKKNQVLAIVEKMAATTQQRPPPPPPQPTSSEINRGAGTSGVREARILTSTPLPARSLSPFAPTIAAAAAPSSPRVAVERVEQIVQVSSLPLARVYRLPLPLSPYDFMYSQGMY